MPAHIKFTSLCFALGFVAIAVFYHNIYGEESDEYMAMMTEETNPSKVFLENEYSEVSDFIKLVEKGDELTINQAIYRIDLNWSESHEIMLIESLYYSQNKRYADRLLKLLKKKTGKNYRFDFDKWHQYIWNKKEAYNDSYFEFKAKLHERIDPKFGLYFSGRSKQSTIRLDEVRWGGVFQDGIPPLRNPKMISVAAATYLDDSNVVFGIEVNGDARAYPKRILAWHEMFVDTVGDIPVAGVYCTLCGTVILYKTEHNGINHEIGTSGFLYRSNKLMYDKATQSLWSTLEGEPVIGPLVGKGIKFDYLSVVTTTWGEWKKRHPDSSVLSIQTGHLRDYGEGVAYKDYFATDDLMFTIPKIDKNLKNKDEILSIRLPGVTDENFAISSKFLRKHPIYHHKIANLNLTIFTDKTGGHRVYESGSFHFSEYDGGDQVKDNTGATWKLSEERMKSDNEEILERFPTHSAFWFGYRAAFPDTKLIK